MASADHIQSLREEATCSLCLEFYKDPVTIKCGHNFCRHCILRVSSSQGAACDLPCPQCRELCPQGELRINRQLQSMVDIVQQLPVQQPVKLQGESLCQKHQEKLKLFCKEDEGLICVICRESRGHRAHTALPIDEAAQEYKSQLQERLQPLRKEMEALLQSKQKEEEGYRTLRNKLEIERLKIMQEFDVMQQHLKEQEKALLGRLDEMDRSINGAENTHIAKLSSEISSINALISEIEMKSEQLPEDLLKDVRSTLDSWK
ncbi:E3 ubiquitin-protein ligase TRIM39-like isoform X2 [Ambystoma mexicanum]|uniref:E3 ubiquitin-protein ligase TRIM39-like isoform X2 n=1 Tax=Ambystoma mexicanum TaxID=8296 RepID=UPI0037E8B2DC